MIITVKYLCKYRLKFAPNYVFSADKCFNAKTNREIKQVYNGGNENPRLDSGRNNDGFAYLRGFIRDPIDCGGDWLGCEFIDHLT